jgi:hypothetical protein
LVRRIKSTALRREKSGEQKLRFNKKKAEERGCGK